MDKVKDFLTEWAIRFAEHKDIIKKEIVGIKKIADGAYVKYKEREEFFIVIPFIKDDADVLQKIDKDNNINIVVFNTKQNLDFLIRKWNALVEFPKLKFYFVNPFSELDTKWIISPYVHHRISDEASLETGLKSMFAVVEEFKDSDLGKIR